MDRSNFIDELFHIQLFQERRNFSFLEIATRGKQVEVTIFSDIDGRIAIVFLNIKQQLTEALRVYEEPR
jgi:hypothetical protein